jgi:hypothetical protein
MPVLLTGIGDPKANAHGENESVSLSVMRKAILSEALFFSKFKIEAGHGRKAEKIPALSSFGKEFV